jgi:hypothetical protein
MSIFETKQLYDNGKLLNRHIVEKYFCLFEKALAF